MSRAHRHLGDPTPRTGASLPQRRPAETTTLVAGAAVYLAGRALGWDGDVQGAVTVLVAAVPSVVTGWQVRRRRG